MSLRLLKDSEFQQLTQGKALDEVYNAKGKEEFVHETAVPGNSSRSTTAYLRVDQLKAVGSKGGKYRPPVYYLYYKDCGSDSSCKDAKAELEKEAPWKNLTLHHHALPEGARISAILYGDVNGDHKTDIVLKLSTGGAILLESEAPKNRSE